MKLSKSPLYLFFSVVFWVIPSFASELPIAEDFQEDARLARHSMMPILVFFVADYCDYCETVNDLYLQPMYSSGEYSNKLIFRIVNVGRAQKIRDFNGHKTSHIRFAGEAGASLTPAIRFYGPDGQELVPEILGYNSPEFYAAILETAISNAISKLRHPATPGNNNR
ncbi:MAG: thioredoxin family protein [Gammaproteobacteria bacterium]|nr:thioredoxin family protein [Gammaproteobacteria bacterium]